MNGYGKEHDPEESIDNSPEFYDPVAIFLSSVNYSTENLTDELKKCSVTYDQLSGLVEEDLRLMGMKSDLAIKEILSELSQLSKQRRMYDRVLGTEFQPVEYTKTVDRNTVEHLENIKMLIRLTQLKLKRTVPENVLLDNHVYASEISLELCAKILNRLGDIQAILGPDQPSAESKLKSWIRQATLPVMLLSGVLLVSLYWKRHV
ncbi:uncharacterized protein LOC126581020 [Anopheles aquasalis]|uniref:uncharacterized protein LOC126581020 n=1 Tax=Anopheles aquasalis TaxID=42839 RepID=UPI00215AEA3E|nr:uncharacterized protein LOC126581020 [Anopheles aquasalis]